MAKSKPVSHQNSSPPHVAILVETSKSFGRSLLQGIARYSRTHGPWSMYFDELGPDSKLPRWLKTWEGDGVIMRARSRSMLSTIAGLGVPVVDTLKQIPALSLPGVYTDDVLIGHLAADHLVSLGLKNFAYVGVEKASWSIRRKHAFVEKLHQSGKTCQIYSPISRRRFSESWEGGQEDLAIWLQELPKPVGLFAAHDMRAMCVFDACRRGEIAIPEQVAVVGVDNDEVICNMSDPPLTSVPHQGELIGYEAARMLSQLMSGSLTTPEIRIIPPRPVVIRRSTDTLAVDDPLLAMSLKIIRNCAGAITVEELARRVNLSRRTLERRFTDLLQISPHEQISQERLRRIKELLTETDFPLDHIAQQLHMSGAAYLSSFFKDLTTLTPGEYRQESRRHHPQTDFYPS